MLTSQYAGTYYGRMYFVVYVLQWFGLAGLFAVPGALLPPRPGPASVAVWFGLFLPAAGAMGVFTEEWGLDLLRTGGWVSPLATLEDHVRVGGYGVVHAVTTVLRQGLPLAVTGLACEVAPARRVGLCALVGLAGAGVHELVRRWSGPGALRVALDVGLGLAPAVLVLGALLLERAMLRARPPDA